MKTIFSGGISRAADDGPGRRRAYPSRDGGLRQKDLGTDPEMGVAFITSYIGG